MSLSDHLTNTLKTDIICAMQEGVGFKRDIAETLAEQVVKKIQESWGGTQIYIPCNNSKTRNTEIRKTFTGSNHSEVCKKFGISLRTLYRVTGESVS